MNVDGVGAVRSEARSGVQAPAEDYQAQRQAVRAAESNTSVQQGPLDELKRTREAYSQLHGMMLALQNEVLNQKRNEDLVAATQGLALQNIPAEHTGGQVVQLSDILPGLNNAVPHNHGVAGNADPGLSLLRGAEARHEEQF